MEMPGNREPREHGEHRDRGCRIDHHPLPGTEACVQRCAGSHAVILTGPAVQPCRSQDGFVVSVMRPTTDPAAAGTLDLDRTETPVSDRNQGASEGDPAAIPAEAGAPPPRSRGWDAWAPWLIIFG